MGISTNKIRYASPNKVIDIPDDKRVFVIGDLDADYNKFLQAIHSVSFDPHADVLISLGDVIDRGNDSLKLLDTFSKLGVYMVLGNHEHMMLEALAKDQQAYDLWIKNGGLWHKHSDKNSLLNACNKLISCPLSILLNYQGEKIGLSHTLATCWDWQQPMKVNAQLISDLLWDRQITQSKKLVQNLGVLFSIHGHNATAKPYWIENTYHIDTNYLGGSPTIVELSELIKNFKTLIN